MKQQMEDGLQPKSDGLETSSVLATSSFLFLVGMASNLLAMASKPKMIDQGPRRDVVFFPIQ